jgi:hypothetical protein
MPSIKLYPRFFKCVVEEANMFSNDTLPPSTSIPKELDVSIEGEHDYRNVKTGTRCTEYFNQTGWD